MNNKDALKNIIELIANRIKSSEFENNTYLVGGYVRDLLLNNDLNDLDFVVNLPQGGIALANFLYRERLCSKPVIYKRFGTAMVQIGEHKVEFVMTRSENYREKDRHPEVTFTNLNNDAFRRDFTINALYYDISNKTILDVTQLGINDLKKKIIRASSNPDIIFQEDPLRILRAIRFAARLDFTIEETTKQGITRWKDCLQYISIERIKDEFIQMMLKKGLERSLLLCYEFDIIKYILPPLTEKREDLVQLLKNINKYPYDLMLRLSLISLASKELDELEKCYFQLKINKKLVKKALLITSCLQNLIDEKPNISLNQIIYYKLDVIPHVLKILHYSFPEYKDLELVENLSNLFNKVQYPLKSLKIIRRLQLKSNKEKNFFILQGKKLWIDNPHLSEEEILKLLFKLKSSSMDK